jgi:hypothetical protein
VSNEWNKTAMIEEFDAMLRRRLRSGAAPVVACAGFDLDAASAYLEDALGGAHRSGYESHLAGCATCRRHLIALARLAQSAPQSEAQPVTTPDRIPAWDRWKEAIADWFDPSAWNLKWQMAGATGAAFTVLIAALVAQSWRTASDKTAEAFATNPIPTPATVSDAQSLQSPEPSPQDISSIVAMTLGGEQSRNLVPEPSIPPREGEPKIAIPSLNEELAAVIPNQSSEPPVAARLDSVGARAAQETSDRASGFGSIDFRDGAKQQATKGIFPSPADTTR